MPENSVFTKLRDARMSDEVEAQIRAAVASGKLPIGTKLPAERILAEQLGVSRNTLRLALRALEHAGLIRRQMGASGGAFIQDRSGAAIMAGLVDMYSLGGILPQDLTQARIMYESIIIRLACEKASAADIDALNDNIAAAEEARKSNDFDARIALHIEFHRMLARIAGNSIMVVVMNGVLDIMIRFLQTIGPYSNTFVTPSRRRFMKHFAARDADAAVEEMETLLKRLERTYLSRVPAAMPAAKKA
ncbi:MAG: FadR/GntR family transcriptional regulator [Janthinobacterium lividum]